MRASGVLFPVSSIPSKYGIGCFSKEAYDFVDKLVKGGQTYWQVLPLGPTGYGDSPYQSFSTCAGNPYFIDLATLVDEGLLKQEEVDACDFGDNDRYVDYEKIYNARFALLRKAYERYEPNDDFWRFKNDNAHWLDDYSFFMAIKNHFGGKCWIDWPDNIRKKDPEALGEIWKEVEPEVWFYHFQQYEFNKQWQLLKSYANEKGIEIVGDIPIYVAFDSADAWSRPELFEFDQDIKPISVAGCPPDAFSATGQLWGNPLYKWSYHRNTGYSWWVNRMKHMFELFDVVRIDHFRGFESFYSIPYGDQTAEFGKWVTGPGIELFKTINHALGDKKIIAEDLGTITEPVRKLLKESGYPGMKVLHFAFDDTEDGAYLPHNYDKNCVVYTGTHDNNTTMGWLLDLNEHDRKFAEEYMNVVGMKDDEIRWELIRLALSSCADTAIVPIQDYLGLDMNARINAPSTLGLNWKWRMLPGELTDDIVEKMFKLTKTYARLNKTIKK